MRTIGLAMLMAGMAVPVAAQMPEPKCLVPSHTWDAAGPLAAGTSGVGAALPASGIAMVGLVDAARVGFPMPLGRPAAAGDKAGLVALHVTAAGTYRIALQHKAWIDVVQGGKGLDSVAHAHGEPCSGIAKVVDFALVPGDYTLQLSATPETTIGLKVTKQP
jgi:hypothetical protein